MSIQQIVEQALSDGYLTPTMEAEVGQICEGVTDLSLEEYMALDRLMGSLLAGEVVAVPNKQFINVMEELVITEVITQIAVLEGINERDLDISDVAAYALNRLPPLYATSEEGSLYQRERAQKELQNLINTQVNEGIHRFLDCPTIPGRNPLEEKKDWKKILEKWAELLKSLAPD